MTKVTLTCVLLLFGQPVLAGGRTGTGCGSSQMDRAIRFALDGINLVMQDLMKMDHETALETMKSHCAADGAPTSEQIDACAAIIVGTMDQIAMLSAAGPRRVKIVTAPGDHKRFRHQQPEGTKFVAAKTKNNLISPIYLNYEIVRSYRTNELVTLLYHELLHKIEIYGDFINEQVHGAYIKDELPAGDFDQGKDLLDAAGYAVAIRIIGINLKFWDPVASERDLDWFRCSIETENRAQKVLRWSEERVPLNKKIGLGYLTGVAPKEPHGVDITDLVAPLLGEEATGKSYHFRLLIRDQGNCDRYSKRSSQMELVVHDQFTNELDVYPEAWNESLVCQEPESLIWEIDDLMTIDCSFEGVHQR